MAAAPAIGPYPARPSGALNAQDIGRARRKANGAPMAAHVRRLPCSSGAADTGPTNTPDGVDQMAITTVVLGPEAPRGKTGPGVVRVRLRRHTNAEDTPVVPGHEEAQGRKRLPGAVLNTPAGARAAAALPGSHHAAAVLQRLLFMEVAKVASPATRVARGALVGPSLPPASA